MFKQHKEEMAYAINISVLHFSQSHSLASEVAQEVSKLGNCIQVTENNPRNLQNRDQVVQWSSAIIILAEAKFQRSSILMELINYAHTSKLPILAVIAQSHYEPSGALAAIITAHETVVNPTLNNNWKTSLITMIKENKKIKEKSAAKPILNDADSTVEISTKVSGSNTAFLSYHDDGINCLNLIEAELKKHGIGLKRCVPNKTNNTAIDDCKVFVAILSPKYQDSKESMSDLDFARLKKKEIIPVNSVPKAKRWRASGWLGLSIAGKLYHRLSDKEAAYKQQYDSSPMNDFVYAVKAGLQDYPTEIEAEETEINVLQNQINELKTEFTKLGGTWPPPACKTNSIEESFKHLSVEDSQPNTESKLPYNYIHYEVTRMTFEPPAPLFDQRGIPIHREFDVMFSYQWDIQDMVRDLYQQGRVHNLHGWLDIWGGMEGNVNDSMARAVESSAAILCFLTTKYQESDNCMLELKYAIKRDKPIIFILVEPNMKIESWIQTKMNQSVVITMTSMSEAGTTDRGIPKIFRIMETIKTVAAHEKKRKRRREDVSATIYDLECLVNDAKEAIHAAKGTKRFSKCSRCDVDFEPEKPEGCTKHGAYFMGGNIIAGRWVCCGQTKQTSPGCEGTKHITQQRQWTTIQGGCHKWMPE